MKVRCWKRQPPHMDKDIGWECQPSYVDEDIVYSPNKYRETEGVKDRHRLYRNR